MAYAKGRIAPAPAVMAYRIAGKVWICAVYAAEMMRAAKVATTFPTVGSSWMHAKCVAATEAHAQVVMASRSRFGFETPAGSAAAIQRAAAAATAG